jgi:hypothetical protein
MLTQLERQFPEWAGLVDMVQAAEWAKQEIIHRREQAENAVVDDDGNPIHAPTLNDYNVLQQLQERPLKFLLPQLKAMEVKAGGLEGGPITVVFEAPE